MPSECQLAPGGAVLQRNMTFDLFCEKKNISLLGLTKSHHTDTVQKIKLPAGLLKAGTCKFHIPNNRRRATSPHCCLPTPILEWLGLTLCCNIDLRPHKASPALYITPHSAVIYSIKSNITLPLHTAV